MGISKDKKEHEHSVHEKKARGRGREISSAIKWIIALCIAIIALVIVVVIVKELGRWRKEPHVTLTYMTMTDVAEVIDIEELATYRTKYNGIVGQYASDQEPTRENALYFVAYESNVTLGIDLKKNPYEIEIVNPDAEHAKGKVIIRIPAIEILETSVEIGSLDFMFQDKKSKKDDSIVATAYQLCIADANEKVLAEKDIFELAKESCVNSIRALVKPFLLQYEKKYNVAYDLVIEWDE